MAETRLICPECNATLRLKEEVPDGKRVRCPKCKTTFIPTNEVDEDDVPPVPARRSHSARYDDDEETPVDRPRKKKRKKQKTNPAMILIPIAVAVVVLVGGGIAAAIYFSSDPTDKKSEPPPIKAVAGTPPVGKGNSGVNPNAGPTGKTGIAVGNLAMEIDAEDIDGKQFKLSDYRGKVVVLDFWGNW